MIEVQQVIDALSAYRQRLKNQGFAAKAAVVGHCINLVKKLANEAR